jgi:hypothetical protein
MYFASIRVSEGLILESSSKNSFQDQWDKIEHDI